MTNTHTHCMSRTEDIPMQVCEPYDLHKTKQNERVNEECQISPDTFYENMSQ